MRSIISAPPANARSSGSRSAASGDLSGQLGDVLALVAVLGQRLAAGARADRLAEPQQLRAGVVEVVLARHLVAGELEQPGERVAVRGVAARSPRSAGPSGWRRRTRRFTRSRSAAVPPPQSSPAASTCAAAAMYQASARKTFRNPGPATSTFSTRSPRRSLQRRAEPLGDLARRRLERRGEQHRGVRRVVAEAGLAAAARASASRRRCRARRRRPRRRRAVLRRGDARGQ